MKNYFKNLTVKRTLAWIVVFAICAYILATWYVIPIIDFFKTFEVSFVMGTVFVLAWIIGASIVLFILFLIVVWAFSELNKI